jgi:hypothetical protein
MKQYLIGVLLGVCLGLLIGALLGAVRQDTCQTRVSSQHVSFCLDSKIDKAMRLFR